MREPRLLLAWLVVLVGCGQDAPAVAPRDPSESVGERGSEAPRLGAASPASTCAADLAAQTPESVRGALGDLGYAQLFEDICTAQRAEAQGDPSACSTLGVSTLRERCIARVAIASGHPSDCPPARTVSGRDPLCLALAARDRRLCVVAVSLDRAVCEAALGQGAACNHLPGADREACATRAADLAPRIHGEVRTSPALETSMSMRVGTETRTSTVADRGARLIARGCTRVLVLGDQSHLSAPFGLAALAFDVVVTGETPIEAALSGLPSEMASTLSATVDGIRTLHASGGTVTITRLEPELGGVVEGTLHAAFAGTVPSIDATFTSFVRDLESPCE